MEKKTGQDMRGEQMTPEDTRYWLSYAEKFPRVLRNMSPMEIKRFVEAVVEHHARHKERTPMAQAPGEDTLLAKFQQEREEQERGDRAINVAHQTEALRRRYGEKSGD